ncbi:hypothetical protein CF319_g8558 [Tilletia indica]|nr:hypothetical protein CF319_g8558 [Tilletia indica]
MDETGVQRGTPSVAQWFVVPAGAHKDLRPAVIDGSQELTTVIECIRADGSVLSPLCVLKGTTLDLSEIVDEQHGGSVTALETGWTNTLITMRWFEEVFLPNSERISGSGKPRVLIMVGLKTGTSRISLCRFWSSPFKKRFTSSEAEEKEKQKAEREKAMAELRRLAELKKQQKKAEEQAKKAQKEAEQAAAKAQKQAEQAAAKAQKQAEQAARRKRGKENAGAEAGEGSSNKRPRTE